MSLQLSLAGAVKAGGEVRARRRAKSIGLTAVLALLVGACRSFPSISDDEAQQIAAARLQPIAADRGKAIETEVLSRGMTISRQGDKILATVDDSANRMSWAVIIRPDGSSDVSSMPIE